MSVLKAKRSESQLEVFHHMYTMRKEITELLLRDFGYSKYKHEKKIHKLFGNRDFDSLEELQKQNYIYQEQRLQAFENWFIEEERAVIMDCMRKIMEEIFVANAIYPTCEEELTERRIHQDRAIGQCYRLVQELMYTAETLPVNINKYTRFADDIQREIDLLKGWRRSNNKLLKNG